MNWHQKNNMFKKSIMFKCKINIEKIFPNEIMLKIFSNLDLKDLGRCAMVSKTFCELSHHSMFILFKDNSIDEDEPEEDLKSCKLDMCLLKNRCGSVTTDEKLHEHDPQLSNLIEEAGKCKKYKALHTVILQY